MEPQLLAIIYTSFFVAAFIKGLTGLGFVSLCLPVISSFIDIRIAIPLVIIPSLSSNVMVIIQTRRLRESLSRFWLLYISALPGLYIGVNILASAGNYAGRIVLGAASIAYSLYLLLNLNITTPQKYERYLSVPIGLANGTVNGLTGSQVMPMLPYLISLRLHRDLLINAINTGFTISTLVLLLLLHEFDLLSFGVIKFSVIGIAPVAAGVYLGGKLRYLLSEDKFRIAVLIILLLIGANLILNP